jgi:hypothetical protein
MEQSTSLEANSQEILRILWNLKVHYRVHKGRPLVPNLSQMNPVHSFLLYFPKIQTNIKIPSTPVPSEWSLPFEFSDQNLVRISHLSHVCYVPCPFHLDLFTLSS